MGNASDGKNLIDCFWIRNVLDNRRCT